METVCFDCTKYDPTDWVAQVLAYLCSAPHAAVVYQASVVYCRRELHAITTLVGMVANAALSKGLKRILRQLMFFVWAMHALVVFRRRPRSRAQTLLRLAESVILGLASVAVADGRVYLGYHDVSQVTVGAVLGSGFGLVWFVLTMWMAGSWFGSVLRWPVSEFLGLKDTFSLGPDVLSWERRQCPCSKEA